MNVLSTRDPENKIPAMRAVLQGIAEDGGLFVPEHFPQLDMAKMCKEAQRGYTEVSATVMSEFFELGRHRVKTIADWAYQVFDAPEILPLVNIRKNEYMLELFHGPTLAFKDVALQVLPQLIADALELYKIDQDVMVLTATSGDTGKAALEGFRDVPHTSILVFYPLNGVAPMQKLQMVTQEGKNTAVCAVKGNFDDAQNGVKAIFTDAAFIQEAASKGFMLSSANSINFGRLIPQVAYYVYAYAKLVGSGVISLGDPVNFCVPTGNFGNILAAYYAMRMGVPVGKLICASNRNNVLTEFFDYGHYDANREFFKTMSPSMDILVSSNLERLLFELTGRDGKVVADWMKALQSSGDYMISKTARDHLAETFFADFCTEEETSHEIKLVYDNFGYLMDPHTAVAQAVYRKYAERTQDDTPTVVASTASPYKFPQDVLWALTGTREEDAFKAADAISDMTGTAVPKQISDLLQKPILHGGVVEKGGQMSAVREFIEKELNR